MKDKPSEWIAISDLMAGVMAVVMLLLVMAVLQQSVSQMQYEAELAKAKGGQGESVAKVMATLQSMLQQNGTSELMSLDMQSKRLTLRDGVFERGSACMTADAKAAAVTVQTQLAQFLKGNPQARILVEGYSDNVPVRQPVVDYQKFCTVYDDNFTLSAARAREARKALVGALDEMTARRVVVAGYGESRPLPGIAPEDPKNRRVEVQFVIDQARS